MDLRELEKIDELRACERVQRAVWGESEPEISAALFRATQHAGALVAGAFAGDKLLGFVYSFPSYVARRVSHHSHLLAVLPEARGRGVGQALKWFQREWCLARGVTRVTWTFDPIRAKNANLNLEHLGASVRHYEIDFYGKLGGALNGALPTDRVLAEWPLDAAHVAKLAAGERRLAVAAPSCTLLLCDEDNEPQFISGAAERQRVRLELPPQISPDTDFAHALRWRLALRQTLRPLLAGGYSATRFAAGSYVLAPSQA